MRFGGLIWDLGFVCFQGLRVLRVVGRRNSEQQWLYYLCSRGLQVGGKDFWFDGFWLAV